MSSPSQTCSSRSHMTRLPREDFTSQETGCTEGAMTASADTHRHSLRTGPWAAGEAKRQGPAQPVSDATWRKRSVDPRWVLRPSSQPLESSCVEHVCVSTSCVIRRCPSTFWPPRHEASPGACHPSALTDGGSLRAAPAFLCKHRFLNHELHLGSGSPRKVILRDLGSNMTLP